jgi:hypothetical protein
MENQYITQSTAVFIGDKTYPPRYVSLVLGNPRSEECAGFGICRFDEEWPLPGQMPPPPEPPPSPKPSKPKRPKNVSSCLSGCCSGVAMIERFATQAGKISLSFSFLKSDLTPEAIKKHFSATHFRVGSAVLLPTTLTKAFDMAPSVFEAGLYQITETKDYFQIQLPIKE